MRVSDISHLEFSGGSRYLILTEYDRSGDEFRFEVWDLELQTRDQCLADWLRDVGYVPFDWIGLDRGTKLLTAGGRPESLQLSGSRFEIAGKKDLVYWPDQRCEEGRRHTEVGNRARFLRITATRRVGPGGRPLLYDNSRRSREVRRSTGSQVSAGRQASGNGSQESPGLHVGPGDGTVRRAVHHRGSDLVIA